MTSDSPLRGPLTEREQELMFALKIKNEYVSELRTRLDKYDLVFSWLHDIAAEVSVGICSPSDAWDQIEPMFLTRHPDEVISNG